MRSLPKSKSLAAICSTAAIALLLVSCTGDERSNREKEAVLTTSTYNDTGIDFGGNHPRTVNEECKGEIDATDEWLMGEEFAALRFSGQDCEHGRDAEHSDHSDGYAGFSFLKIGTDGEALASEAEQWHCVLDGVTGLMWESKTAATDSINSSLHNSGDQYAWYNTNSSINGGSIGDWNRDHNDCFGYQDGNPASFCNTEAFVNRVNAESLCSHSDWRLPTLAELSGIIHYGTTQPSIDSAYFPHTQSDSYWTSSPSAASSEVARLINFKFGLAGISLRMDRHHVRLVRTNADE